MGGISININELKENLKEKGYKLTPQEELYLI